MLVSVTEEWPGLAGVQKIGLGVNWLAKKLNITGTIDNKGQNKNFIDGESKNEVEKLKYHIKSMVQGVLRFGFYAVTKTLQEIEILARSVYEIFLFRQWWTFPRVIKNWRGICYE